MYIYVYTHMFIYIYIYIYILCHTYICILLYICLHEVRIELRLKGSEGLHSLKYQGSFAKEP